MEKGVLANILSNFTPTLAAKRPINTCARAHDCQALRPKSQLKAASLEAFGEDRATFVRAAVEHELKQRRRTV